MAPKTRTKKCKTCKNPTQKDWNYCPKCGGKTKEEKGGIDLDGIFLEKIKYNWERRHGGKIIYDNFDSVNEVGYPFKIKKIIRPRLTNYVNLNFFNLRLFSFLFYKPDYLNELMKIYKSYGYYSAYFTAKNANMEKYVGSNIEDKRVWEEVIEKNVIKFFKEVFQETKTAIPLKIYIDQKNRKFIAEITESSSSLLKSNKPLCFFEIASCCGPLEVFSNCYWSGKEVKCQSKGDEKCELVLWPSKTENFENIEQLTSEEFRELMNQSVENLMKKDAITRGKLGNQMHIFDDQLLNYYLVSLSPGHNILSKYSGSFVGQQIIERTNIRTQREVIEYLISLLEYMQVGLLRIKSIQNNSIVLSMDESAYSSGIKAVNMKLDTFIAGIIEGALIKATNQKWQIEETKCLANGDECCQFVGILK